MTMESFATPYPVVFHDGEKEHDKGYIGVHSVLTFKRFQSLLTQKVGLPSGQMSAVFVCRRTSKDTISDSRQKLPINENTNFSIILNQHNPKWEKDCHFLVTTKKSKKERKGTTGRRRSTDQEENGEEFIICHSLDPVQKDRNHMSCTDLVNHINTKQSLTLENMLSSTNLADMDDVKSLDDKIEPIALMDGMGYNRPARKGMVDTQQSVDLLHLNGDPQQPNLFGDCNSQISRGSSQTNIQSSQGLPQTRQEHNSWSHRADHYTSFQCMMNPGFNNQQSSPERKSRLTLIPDNSSSSSLIVPDHHQSIVMSSPSAQHANLITSHHVKLLNRSDQKILLTRGEQQAALMNSSPLVSTTAINNARLHEKMYNMEKQIGANMANILSRGRGICNFYPRQILQDGGKQWSRNHTVDQPNMFLRDDHSSKSWQLYHHHHHHHHHNLSIKASEDFQERYNDALLGRPSLIQGRDGLLNPNGLSKDDHTTVSSQVFSPTGGNNNILLLKNPGLVVSGTQNPNLQKAQTHYWSYNTNGMIHQQQSLASSDLHQNVYNSKIGVNATVDMSKIRGLVCSLNSDYQNNINHKSSSATISSSSSSLARGGLSCQLCYKFRESKIDPPPFHLCVQDKITVGFKGPSPAGPIERPAAAKTRVEFIAAA